jgi:hypothetical protein
MKTLIICPGDRPGVSSWAESTTLAALPLFGQSLLEHWLEHLVRAGAKDVRVLASDRPEQIRALVGDGSRWGLRITVCPEQRELTPTEARARHIPRDDAGWLAAPLDIVVADHFPDLPECHVFRKPTDAFAAVVARLERTREPDRIGLRQIRPGVWVGMHARISPKAELHAPCWIGNDVCIGAHAVVGPHAVLEDRVLVEAGAAVVASAVAPDTMVGAGMDLRNSLAAGSTLFNWRTGSHVFVPDKLWLAPVPKVDFTAGVLQWFGRMLALLLMELTVPIGAGAMLLARLRGEPAFVPKAAVRPRVPGTNPWPDTIEYYEMNCNNRWLKRWPQLWNVATGEFAWVGNRPLSSQHVRLLANSFERRGLDTRVGLVSLADAELCFHPVSEEACAHASFYTATANWRLDAAILCRVAQHLVRRAADKGREELSSAVPAPVTPTTQRL